MGGKFRYSRFKQKKIKKKREKWLRLGCTGAWAAGILEGEVRVLSLGRKGEMELAGPDLASCNLSWWDRDPHPLLGQLVGWGPSERGDPVHTPTCQFQR